MSKAQEKRDRDAERVAWNIKAREEYAAREVRDAAFEVFEDATTVFELAMGDHGTGAQTEREETIVTAAFLDGEKRGRADALADRADEDIRIIEDKIEWLRYRFPDTTMTTLEVLEAMLDEAKALR